jgi:hypothetical protein
MPTVKVKNLSYGHLSIERGEREPLTLGPRETAEISDVEFDSDEIRKHLREGQLAVIPGAPAERGGRASRGGGRSRRDEGEGSGTTPAE